VNTPNIETAKVLKDSENGIGIIEAVDMDDLLKKLEIEDPISKKKPKAEMVTNYEVLLKAINDNKTSQWGFEKLCKNIGLVKLTDEFNGTNASAGDFFYSVIMLLRLKFEGVVKK